MTLFPKLLLLLELKIFTTHAKALISKTNTRKILANMKVVRSGTVELLAPCELMLLLLKKSPLFRLRTPRVCAKSKQQIKRGHRATTAQWSSGYALKAAQQILQERVRQCLTRRINICLEKERKKDKDTGNILWVCACVIYQFWHALVREYKAGSAPPKIMCNSNKKTWDFSQLLG